jgi:hypothetical protein
MFAGYLYETGLKTGPVRLSRCLPGVISRSALEVSHPRPSPLLHHSQHTHFKTFILFCYYYSLLNVLLKKGERYDAGPMGEEEEEESSAYTVPWCDETVTEHVHLPWQRTTTNARLRAGAAESGSRIPRGTATAP